MTLYEYWTKQGQAFTYNFNIINYKKLHRIDGPAYIVYNGRNKKIYEIYYKNGKRHREDGPALIHYDTSTNFAFDEVEYYITNIHVEKYLWKLFKKGFSIYTEKWSLNHHLIAMLVDN